MNGQVGDTQWVCPICFEFFHDISRFESPTVVYFAYLRWSHLGTRPDLIQVPGGQKGRGAVTKVQNMYTMRCACSNYLNSSCSWIEHLA